MPNRRNTLFIGLGILAVLVLCLGSIAVGYYGYQFLGVTPATGSGGEPTLDFDFLDTPTEVPPTTVPLTDDGVNLAPLFQPLWDAHGLIHGNYVQQPVDDQVLAQGAIDGLHLLLETHEIDIESIEIPADTPSAEELADQADTPNDLTETFLPFWEEWRVVYGLSAIEGVDDQFVNYTTLMQWSLAGMVDSLGDPQSFYMDPFQLQQTNSGLSGEYEGIGAWVDTSGDYLTIIAPMKGSPAEGAGLKPGDIVVAIDGDDMTGIPGDLVIRQVLGPAGSEVILTIQREGVEEPFDVSIIRAKIVIPNVEYEMLADGQIGYILLTRFSDPSADAMREALETVMAEDPKGLIIDLRGNGGGFLHSVVDIASEFVDEGVIVYEEYGNGDRDIYNANGGGLATDIPLVILVDGGSASASEILAGVVQDYERGWIVGTTTFGKGSVQIAYTLSNNQGAVRITIARWLTPNERHIQGVGLEPDFVVEITDEDIAAGLDPQLQAAIDLLLNQ